MGWDNKLSLHIHMHNVSNISRFSMEVDVNGKLGAACVYVVLYVRTYVCTYVGLFGGRGSCVEASPGAARAGS